MDYEQKREIDELIKCTESGKFELNTEYFNHPDEGISMEFDGGYPVIGPVFSDQMSTLLGEPRIKEDLVQQKHKDIACSLQTVYEKTLFHILSYLNELKNKLIEYNPEIVILTNNELNNSSFKHQNLNDNNLIVVRKN